MSTRIANSLSFQVIEQTFVPDFGAGKVYFAELPRGRFQTDRAFKKYNSAQAGKEALSVLSAGRCVGNFRFQGDRYPLIRARVIWALYHGRWPEKEIGHRNGILSDDRIENLRQQTRSDSIITRSLPNTTGVVGVFLLPNGRYFATVRNRHRTFYVGSFDNLEEARIAREKTALRLQGEFARIVDWSADHIQGTRT